MMHYTEHKFPFEDIEISYLEGGSGFPILLIHGTGPGASTMGNWRLVLEPLMEKYHVFAMDLVGFGNSGRKRTPPYFDFNLWYRQSMQMISMMPGESVGVLGHSLSGALALKLAASNRRISHLMTTATMGAQFSANEATVKCWTYPDTVERLRDVASVLIYDKSLIDDAYIAARKKVLYDNPGYGAYFSEMFAGDKQTFVDAVVLAPDELNLIKCPVTMLHGRDDIAFPPELTLNIAQQIPQACVVLIAHCSHSIAMEHSERFLHESRLLFGYKTHRSS
jgi:2-hydroxymuconate-semialdehyde hydrolase